jgi:tripartite-type tricarboxylate transporter receptor subunit TctC
MQKVAATKAWREYADKNCMLVKFMGGDDYKKFLDEEDANYTAIFKMLGVLK